MTDTIAAPATPAGRGGIAIVRISGKKTRWIAEQILGEIPKPRYAHFGLFKDQAGQAIDEGVALFFPAPNSFTGEDVLELQGHGGVAVVNLLIKAVISLGARLANPGEFSERAFLNNKMDLLQAEAVADLIQASNEQAARASLRSLQGEFSNQINFFLDSLIKLRTYIEAAMDFAEEEIDFLNEHQVADTLNNLKLQTNQIIEAAHQGHLLSNGIHVIIVGAPNVGKSSLLNALSGHETAIVTDIPGTTRDLIREVIHFDGLPIHIIDTAGLRTSSDPIEQEGIRRAEQEIKRADLILEVIDAYHYSSESNINLDTNIPRLQIRNKIDLMKEEPSVIKNQFSTIISISAKYNKGLNLLKTEIKKLAGFAENHTSTFSARERHLTALKKTKRFLESASEQLNAKKSELLAEDLRQAQITLSEITGEFSSDDLLGKIFSNFCVGK